MTQHLSRPEGRIAYSLDGPAAGPLVVLIPGMGDLRSTWRELTGPLVEAGHRVAVMDLRGHGDSDTTFATHGDVVTGQDALALVEHLGGPAVLVGNSMGAGAAAWAAAERPDLVAGLVLTGPFLRERPMPAIAVAVMHGLERVLFWRPWGAALWASYYRGYLNRGTKAPWLDKHVADQGGLVLGAQRLSEQAGIARNGLALHLLRAAAEHRDEAQLVGVDVVEAG